MSFENDKRKINRIINKQIDQSSAINQRTLKDTRIQDKYKNVAPNHSVFKGFVSIFDDDWEIMQLAPNFDPPLGDISLDTQFRNWAIEINRFDERLIPFLYVEPLIRVVGGSIDDGATIRVPYKNTYIRVEDISGETYIKKLTVHVTLYFTDPSITMPYEARLLIGFINPQTNV